MPTIKPLMQSVKRVIPFLLMAILYQQCKTLKTVPEESEQPPVIKEIIQEDKGERWVVKQLDMEIAPSPRQFRGVWIATVANIDWPISPTDPYEKQKVDFLALLDFYQSLNFNAVIVQVRTSGDAFYPSNFAPWSKYLTGTQGKRPHPTEDPLAWMILETQARGMEFHAWLNPYRASMDLDKAALSPEHDVRKYPQWMLAYGGKYYYDPGLPEVRQHLGKVIQELVQNYSIDAVHFDDYFYPYKTGKETFPDQKTYQRYKKPGQSIEDWRRENVNQLIRELSSIIKAEKPWVQFGISPFGVWRNKDKDPKGSDTQAGQTNYDDLYADVLTWMQNGWINYLIPQLYWSLDYAPASHRKLLAWWSENHYDTKIYIGNGPYKIRDNADKAWDNPREIPDQIALGKNSPNISGNAFFSAKSLFAKNADVANLLFEQHYHSPVLSPAAVNTSLPMASIPDPVLIPHGDGTAFLFEDPLPKDYRFAIVRTSSDLRGLRERSERDKFEKIYLEESNRFLLPILRDTPYRFASLSFIDRFGRESKSMVFEIEKSK